MFTQEEYAFYRQLPIYKRSLLLVHHLFKGKKDKADTNYMNHLNHVSRDFKTDRKKSLGLMHDVLEDTPTTEEDLRLLGYDEKFITTLKVLTKTTKNYDTYIETILKSNDKDAMEIKIKDLLHNLDLTRLKKITEVDIKRARKYLRAYTQIIEKLEGEENDRY
mgnify:CR=1 FL=1